MAAACVAAARHEDAQRLKSWLAIRPSPGQPGPLALVQATIPDSGKTHLSAKKFRPSHSSRDRRSVFVSVT